MGRPKKELKRIHRKKMRSIREKVKSFRKGQIPLEKLPQRAKKLALKKKAKKTS